MTPRAGGWVVAAALLAAALATATAWADARFVAVQAGLDFRHQNGMVGERWLVEVMGAGVALLDFDGDGRLDVWLVQGGPLADRSGALPGDRLYRNATAADRLRFQDVTAASGVVAAEYGMGIATGDVDNDGDADVFLANYGPNQLYENLGDGRFRERTAGSGIVGAAWSTSASFADFDGDGRLDLYVANYVDFTLATHKVCRDLASRPTYCSPESYAPTADRLYRNLGDWRFRDVTESAGVAGRFGGALGVVAEDFNSDGRPDFYVANDPVDNLLWLNAGGGRFVNGALLAGVAVNGDGDAEASMGIAAEDFDNDCDVDLFITHLVAETNTLYVNEGESSDGEGAPWFADQSNQLGVAIASVPFTGFGTAWFDADNDGDLDLFAANGAVTEIAEQRAAGDAHPLRQRDQLWLNDGAGRYRETRRGGPAFALGAREEVGRGAAFGDLDNDGDVDIVVANNNGPARIYRNDSPPRRWLGVQLAPGVADGGDGPVRLAAGSTIWLQPPVAGACNRRRIATDGSYASASDPRAVFGLGENGADRHVHVRWPDGEGERFGPLAEGRYHTLRRGAGAAASAPTGDAP